MDVPLTGEEVPDTDNFLGAVERQSLYKQYMKNVYYFLERPENKIATSYHLLNLLLIVGSIILSILSTIDVYENHKLLRSLILYYEISLLCWFSIEYVLRVWSCSFLSKYQGFMGRFRFVRTFYMLVDAFVIISTLTTAVLQVKTTYFTILRVTRFLQVFRILRLDRQRGDIRTMARVVYQHRKELVTCYFVGFIILFGGTYIVYICEKYGEDGSIDNMANGLYWAMITVTSVGYGDFSPATWGGKMVTGVFALIGCAFFGLPAGVLGAGFALQVAKQKKQKRYIKVRNPAAIAIQNCWRNYAVRRELAAMQATWEHFFPHVLAKQANPRYYELLPGIKNFSSYARDDENAPMTATDDMALEVKRGRLSVKRPSLFGKSDGLSSKRNSIFSRVDSRKEGLGQQVLPSNGLSIEMCPLNTSIVEAALQSAMSPTSDAPHPVARERKKSTLSFLDLTAHVKERKKSSASTKELLVSQLLNGQFKATIRFILRVKYWTAVRNFKNVRYPFVNVQDIMEKNSQTHTETLVYLREIKDNFITFRRELEEMRRVMGRFEIAERDLGDGIHMKVTSHSTSALEVIPIPHQNDLRKKSVTSIQSNV